MLAVLSEVGVLSGHHYIKIVTENILAAIADHDFEAAYDAAVVAPQITNWVWFIKKLIEGGAPEVIIADSLKYYSTQEVSLNTTLGARYASKGLGE